MKSLPEKALLRVDEVASYFSVSRSTVYLWIDLGMLPAEKYRKTIRVPREAVLTFRAGHKVDPDEQETRG